LYYAQRRVVIKFMLLWKALRVDNVFSSRRMAWFCQIIECCSHCKANPHEFLEMYHFRNDTIYVD